MSLWFDRIFTAGILFLILFTPFAFGTVHPWAYTTMEVVIFSLVIVWMAKRAILAREHGAWSSEHGAERLTPYASRLTPVAVPLLLFILLVLFQLAPLPPSLLRIISPQTYEFYTQVLPGWPLRVPYGELDTLVRGEGLGVRRDAGSQEQSAKGEAQSVEPRALNATNAIDANNAINVKDASNSVNSQTDIRNAEGSSRLTPDASRLFPETWLPLSLAPSLSKTDLLKFAAFAALFFLVCLYPFEKPFEDFGFRNSNFGFFVLSPEQRFLRSIVFAVLGTGLLVAAVGFIQRFTWNGKILWFFVPYSWGQPMPNGVPRASGPFVNPDHFANYLALIFPIALACALVRTFMVPKSQESGFKIFCGLTAFILFTSILLSLSRGGWVGTLLGGAILIWLSPWQGARQRAKSKEQGAGSRERGRSQRSEVRGQRSEVGGQKAFAPMARLSLLAVGVLLIVSLLIVGSEGREQVDARLGQTFGQDLGLLARMEAWKNSLPMIRDFPVFGVGLAAWPEVFSRYQPGPWSADYFHEAHNDYVELLADMGAIGFALLAWFFIRGGKRLVRGIKKAPSKNLPLMAAVLAALGIMAFHELLDFSLQIPANAFLFTLLFALGLRLARQARDRRSEVGDQLSELGDQPYAISYTQSAMTPEWSEVRDQRPEVRGQRSAFKSPGSLLHALSSMRIGASRLTPYAVGVVAVALVVCAVRQEQSVKRPESVAEAKERIFSRPSKASYHMAMLRVMKDKAPLSWQLSEYKAALWIEPTNPYTRDRYASTLLSMGKTDEGLREITRSVAESPSLKRHEYLSAEALPRLSEEERSAVAEGFRQALARDYPETLKNFAEFYAALNRFSDQAALYEQAALKETDVEKRTELLINGGLAYLKAADKQGAGSSEQGAKGKEQSTEGPAQGAGSVEQGIQKIRNPQSEIRNIDAPHASRLTPHGIEDAERVFRAAVTANPTNPKPYQQLVTAIYAARKDLAGAKEIISQGIKNGAPPLPLYLSLAEAAQAAGNAKESKAALESAKVEVDKLVKNGESPYTLYIALAEGGRRAGDRDQESAALLKALDLQPRSPDVLSRLASLYFEKQNYDRAALYLNRVANINPDSADLYYRLAQAEEGRYRFADAGRAYARAVELAPENASYRERYEEFRERVERNRVTSREQGAGSRE